MARDIRLDVWRGLCLVDVVLVHLAYNGIAFPDPLDALIKHYTRFAAGGFVFLAGLTVATVFGPKVEGSSAERWGAYRWLWRRAGLLLLVDVCASVGYRLFDVVRRVPADPYTPLSDALRSIILLQRPGLTGGILLLYSILLSATPAVLVFRQRRGAWPVAAVSLAAYAVALATGDLLAWPRTTFPVLYWQPIFVAGLLSANWHPATDTASFGRRLVWTVGASVAFAAVFAIQFGPAVGFEWLARVLPLDFGKMPLQPGGLIWYLAIVQLILASSSLVWSWAFSERRIGRWLALLGRHSLLVYTAHVFTEIVVMEYVWSVWPPVLVRMGLAAADVAALYALGVAVERAVPARCAAWLATVPHIVRAWPRAAAATATAATLCIGMLYHSGQSVHVTAVPPSLGVDTAVTEIADDFGSGQLPLTDLLFEEGGDAEGSHVEPTETGDESESAPPGEAESAQQITSRGAFFDSRLRFASARAL